MVQSYVWLRLAERLGHAPAAPMAALVEKRLSAAQRAQADSVLAPAPKKG